MGAIDILDQYGAVQAVILVYLDVLTLRNLARAYEHGAYGTIGGVVEL